MRAIINNFSNAITNDPRDTGKGLARVVTGFNVSSYPRSMVPYRDSEDGNSNASNDQMQAFCIALRTGTTYSLYGLGRTTAADKVRVLYKNLTTGASTDLDDNGWTETTNNVSATQATVNYNCFVYYPRLNMIFGGHGSRYIWEYDPDGGTAFNETDADLTAFTNLAQGVVHSKDDTLYIPYDNKIAKNDNGTWTVAALTIPNQFYITSICEFGDLIAIAAAPLSGTGNSRVFLWNRVTSALDLDENVDWGYGIIKILEELDGYLVGISIFGNSTIAHKNRVFFKYYTGSSALSVLELIDTGTGTQTTLLPIAKQKINNRVHFLMQINLNGSVREGVWSFGKNVNGQFSIVHERTSNNDTALSTGTLRGFFYVGDYLFIAYNTSGGVYTVSKTNDSASYSASSIVESCINEGIPTEHKMLRKQLTAIGVLYTTLSAAAGQVVLKYKVDGGSYTTVLTATTTGVNVIEEVKDASASQFTAGREYEFRVESTLGAEIISVYFDYELLETLIS